MSNADFKDLLDKYLNDSLSVDELHELEKRMLEYENTEALRTAIHQALTDNSFKDLSDKSRTDIVFRKIMQQAGDEQTRAGQTGDEAALAAETIPLIQQPKPRIWRRIAVAAIFLSAIAGYYLLWPRPKNLLVVHKQPAQSNDVAPGRNKAILQLADSSSIVLDDSDTGMLAQQGSTKILKLGNGQLTYHTGAGHHREILYNVISTPRGGQYQVILPDGTRVWLNAASSLRFPTAFTGKERTVSITGEAYFDIAPDKNMPFKVQTGDTKVEVLGTQFNIMAYSNEEVINTTLVNGAVRVSMVNDKPGEGLKLLPGQQATRNIGSTAIIAHEVDTESVVAWKNGTFQFDNNDIPSIMRQLERWYDIDVHYAGKAPEGHYSWTVGKDKSLMKVLRILEESDLKFKIEGKNLTVL